MIIDKVREVYLKRSQHSKRFEEIHNLLYSKLGLIVDYGRTHQSIKYKGELRRSLFHLYLSYASKNYNPYNEDAIEFVNGNAETIDAYNDKQSYVKFPYQKSKYGIIFPFIRYDDATFDLFLIWLQGIVKKINI